MELGTYYRSGAAWRVRIGLHWKGVAFDSLPINLAEGDQQRPEWLALNPQGLIPALKLDDGTLLTQSLAILEWLEETYPERPFLPENPTERAKVRAVALAITADTHPLQNRRILAKVEALAGREAAQQWARDILTQSLTAVEALIAKNRGPFAFGLQPTLADIVLIPQLANARRFRVDLKPFRHILEAEAAAGHLPFFQAAHPANQPDTPQI